MVISPCNIRCNDCLRQSLVYGHVSYPPEVYIIYSMIKHSTQRTLIVGTYNDCSNDRGNVLGSYYEYVMGTFYWRLLYCRRSDSLAEHIEFCADKCYKWSENVRCPTVISATAHRYSPLKMSGITLSYSPLSICYTHKLHIRNSVLCWPDNLQVDQVDRVNENELLHWHFTYRQLHM